MLKVLRLIVLGLQANDLHSLVSILVRSLVLEKLTLQLSWGYEWTGESEGRYRQLDQLPGISELLDKVEIKCRNIDERVFYIMDFLGGFIKHININLDSKPTCSRQAPGSAVSGPWMGSSLIVLRNAMRKLSVDVFFLWRSWVKK
ncbi:hypothetical protein EJB05_28911 [Eragrostis curvula]|uniref:Uncharacterized protein n=1 Tax=Eragrostis curvula TaxID=38414 RepID=A0A5J9USS9_9POAL|nr:hypothetical protein EJB05_28911 [Eragrostis curvula]